MERIDDLLLTQKLFELQHQMIPTGFDSLDHTIPFLNRGALSILAARPGMGKKTLAVQIAAKLTDDCRTVVYFSQAFSAETVASKVEPFKLEFGVTTSKLYIEDRMANISKMSSAVAACGSNPDLIIVDDLQECYVPSRKGHPTYEPGRICEALKKLAADHNSALLCLSNVSRTVELRKDPYPKLTDIPGWDSISPHVDFAVLFTRDGYYNDCYAAETKECVRFSLGRSSGTRHKTFGTLIWDRMHDRFEETKTQTF